MNAAKDQIILGYPDQAAMYLIARYGEDALKEDPESLQNILERWLLCVANDQPGMAMHYMLIVELGLKDAKSIREWDARGQIGRNDGDRS